MKKICVCIVITTYSLNVEGQTSIDLSNIFYNLPIDSCMSYIRTKTTDTNLFKTRFSQHFDYFVSPQLWKHNQSIDSVILNSKCLGLASGGSPNQTSPVDFEQWLTHSAFLKSDTAANYYFLNQKALFDSFVDEPYIIKSATTIEWIYSIGSNLKRIKNRQVHLTYEIKKRKITTNYRIIYKHNECNCN